MPGVRVGILHSLSGSMAGSEASLVDAELMAISEINESGGVLGEKIEVLIEDGASDLGCFEAKARKLLQTDRVATLMGCWTSATRLTVKPVLEELNGLLWYPAPYEGLENCRNIFYTGFCANQIIETPVNWLLQNHKRRFYLLGFDHVVSHTLNKLMKVQLQRQGGKVVGEAYLPPDTTDFRAVLSRIQQAQPDVIFNTLTGDCNVTFYRQYQHAGLKANEIPILSRSLGEWELEQIQEAVVGHLSCGSYFPSLDENENHHFIQRFKARYGDSRNTNDAIATAYTQVYLWKQAVELAQSFEVDQVRVAALGQCVRSPGGLVCLEPNHHVKKYSRISRALPNGAFEILHTSEQPVKPLPWLGFDESQFKASDIVIDLLAEVCRGIERAEQLEQKSLELEATKAQLQQEIEARKQFEAALQQVNEDLELKVEERTAALQESNEQLVQEIVQHKQTANALRHARDQIQAVLEAVPGTVSWISSDLRYIEVNHRLAKSFNVPREDFVGQHIGFLGSSSEFIDFMEEFFANPQPDAYREVFTKVRGKERYFLVVAQKYNQDRAAFVVGIDITARKQAEEELRRAKVQLQTVLEAVPGLVSWINSDLCYIEVNQRLANIFNLPRESFVGKHIGFLGSSSEFNDFVIELFATPQRDACREVSSWINGQQHSYLVVAQKYDQDRAAFVVGIDITEHRQAEEALRVTQNQLEAVLEVVPGTVSWISSDLRYLGVNRHLAETFDLPREEFVGQNIGFLKASAEFNGFVQEFFVQPQQDGCREVTSVVREEMRNYLIAGHKYESDKAAFFVGIDITERKRAEEALKKAEANYRSIFENAVEGIFQITPDGRYLSANPALARIYGYDSPQNLMENLVNIADQLYINPRRRRDFIEILEVEGAIVGFESQIRRLDGMLTWISENAFAIRDEQGNLLYYEGTVEDITERKLAEADLQRAKQELEIRVEERTAALREANHQLVVEIAERKRIEMALRESEAELRALFAAMTDVITVFDAQGRYKKIVTTNSEVLYSPTAERLGKSVFEVFPQPHAELFYQQIQKVLNTGQTLNIEYSLPLSKSHPGEVQTQNSEIQGDNAELIWFAATVSPLPDNSVIWVARNTTERRRVLEALRAEQEKSERLLLNILPKSIAERLKQNPHSIAERFDQATIMFADLVDFTGFSARISPTELVDLLNEIFSTFDELADKHQLEKIKTIGDSYMIAGGLPMPREDHAEAIAEMALDMQNVILRFQRDNGQSFRVRIGINTGPVVAGVIGTKKFIYDLWGDAVNVASRMESQGQIGKIQVTAATYELLNHKYNFEERGIIDVRGRGEMVTYWLTGRK